MLRARWWTGAAIVLAAVRPTLSFDEEGRVKIAADALRLAPPALGRQLARHRSELEKGARETVPVDVAEAASRLAADTDALVAMLDGHQPFRKISRTMGRIAGTMGALNDPLWASREASDAADGKLFGAY